MAEFEVNFNDDRGLSDEVWADLKAFVADALPVLRELTPDEREELRLGILAGDFPPPLLAGGTSRYTRAEAAALRLWSKASHITTDRKLAIAGLVLGLLPYAGLQPPGQGGPSADEIAKRVVQRMQQVEEAEKQGASADMPILGPPSGVESPGDSAP